MHDSRTNQLGLVANARPWAAWTGQFLTLIFFVGSLLVAGFFMQAAFAQSSQSNNTTTIALDPNSNLIDSNPDNNEDTAVINVEPQPDISYNKTADVTSASVGDTITYTVTVTVADAPLTQDFVATDTLSPGLAFSGVTSPGNFSCNLRKSSFRCRSTASIAFLTLHRSTRQSPNLKTTIHQPNANGATGSKTTPCWPA